MYTSFHKGLHHIRMSWPPRAECWKPGIVTLSVKSLAESSAALQDIGSAPGTYSLVTQFPRRVIQISQYPDKATFADAGLTGRQEALLLEPAH